MKNLIIIIIFFIGNLYAKTIEYQKNLFKNNKIQIFSKYFQNKNSDDNIKKFLIKDKNYTIKNKNLPNYNINIKFNLFDAKDLGNINLITGYGHGNWNKKYFEENKLKLSNYYTIGLKWRLFFNKNKTLNTIFYSNYSKTFKSSVLKNAWYLLDKKFSGNINNSYGTNVGFNLKYNPNKNTYFYIGFNENYMNNKTQNQEQNFHTKELKLETKFKF